MGSIELTHSYDMTPWFKPFENMEEGEFMTLKQTALFNIKIISNLYKAFQGGHSRGYICTEQSPRFSHIACFLRTHRTFRSVYKTD